jgi:hypothetical protein
MTSRPSAVTAGQRLIRLESGRSIPAYRVDFTLTAEPDPYRVSFTDPRPEAQDREFNLVLSLTITAEEFAAWQAWLDGNPGGTP